MNLEREEASLNKRTVIERLDALIGSLNDDYKRFKLNNFKYVVDIVWAEPKLLSVLMDVVDWEYAYPLWTQRVDKLKSVKCTDQSYTLCIDDFKDIEKWSWWGCATNARALYNKITTLWDMQGDRSIVVWNWDIWFSKEWATHLFLLLEFEWHRIIVDPSLKNVALLRYSWYKVNKKAHIRPYWQEIKVSSHLWFIVKNWSKTEVATYWWMFLWLAKNGKYLLTLTFWSYEDYVTPIVDVKDENDVHIASYYLDKDLMQKNWGIITCWYNDPEVLEEVKLILPKIRSAMS